MSWLELDGAPSAGVVAKPQLGNAPQLQAPAPTRERKKPRACSKPSLIGSGIVVEPERIEVDRREAQVAGDLDLADARARAAADP